MKSLIENISESIDKRIEEELFSEELLNEFATVRARNSHDYVLAMAVNPSPNHIGEPYFKVYNALKYTQATKVARVSFFEPKLIIHKGDKLPWTNMNAKEKKDIVGFLKLTSMISNYTVWDMLKYFWDIEYGFDVGTIDNYMQGNADNDNHSDPSYVSSILEMPNYMEL